MEIREQYISGVPRGFVRRVRPGISAGLGIIACCAGYGKSTYLAQLAEETPGSVLVTLAGYDNSPERVAAALEAAAGGLPESGSDFDTVCRFAEKMSASGGLVLVDNADVVTDKTASAFLTLLCDEAAAGKFRMLLAAREIPGFMLKYLMNGRAARYGIEEMRFTCAETEELLNVLGRRCSDTYANTLYAYTCGWCAGASEIAGAADSEDDITSCVGRTLLGRYIDCEILAGMDSGLLEYLVSVSMFISTPDSEFSSAVLRISDGAAREDRLVTRGVLSRTADGELVFPGVMKDVLSAMISSERRRLLTERASAYYVREKRFTDAIWLFDVSGNAAAAEHILKSNGERFLSNYEFELIGYCGDIIEKNGGSKDPEVLGILAQYYYYIGDTAKMEAAFNMADSMFGRENRYSVTRRLYNGLLRYERNRELYTANVRSACEYLEANTLPMPFLHQKELDTLALINDGEDDSGKLHIYRFGTLRISVGDTEIQCKSRRSAELIAYMLERGGRPVPREELLNMLWSGDIPANAVAMLHNVIYGLRRELSPYGLENVIIYKNKCYMLDMSMITEDDREILDVCEAAENSDKKRLSAHEAVLEKYWGRYLGTSDSRGSQEHKEYYDRCFVNASLMAAELCRERGDRERELMFLKNASEVDPYSEQVVCACMMCCFALGKPDKAKKIYDSYAKLIDEELGLVPSKWLKNEFLSGFANDSEG